MTIYRINITLTLIYDSPISTFKQSEETFRRVTNEGNSEKELHEVIVTNAQIAEVSNHKHSTTKRYRF